MPQSRPGPTRFLSACRAFLALGPAAAASAVPIPVPNAGFEDGEAPWTLEAAGGAVSVLAEAAFEGRRGLVVEGRAGGPDPVVTSARFPIDASMSHTLAWQGRMLAGTGINIYLRFFDAKGVELGREEGRVNTDKGYVWAPGKLVVIPPTGAVEADILIQRPTWRPPVFVAQIDGFSLEATPVPVVAPWAGTYKLRPQETERLTEADLPGPDGLVYPDWTRAGVPGGIPRRATTLRLEETGARTESDIAALLEGAAEKLAASGGGVIELGPGRYYLDEPVMIRGSGVVIRGAGPDKTRLLFRYRVPRGEPRFFRARAGDVLRQGGAIEFHANPLGLSALELRVGDRVLQRRVYQDHWGNTFSLRHGVREAVEALGEGTHVFTAVAEYADGARETADLALTLSREWTEETPPAQLGAINFIGRGNVSGQMPLLADAPRGSRTLRLGDGHGLSAGDRISLVAPASERWRALVGHSSHWHIQAQDMLEVAEAAADTVTVTQPLRTAYLAEDGAHVQRLRVIEGAGLESVHLEQVAVTGPDGKRPKVDLTKSGVVEDLWTSGVIFSNAWGCWMRDVTIRNAGRNAAYFLMAKHVEIRDALFDDVLFKGSGGTGYVGFDRSFDCLMDRVEARHMRHGPNIQWNSSGNVIRDSRFLGSDAQWHAGWTHENLFENNFVDARGKGGSYGYGFYASGPSSGVHGPQGPRNVVYNNDIVARRDGLHMLGGNEAWIVLHNRIDVRGRGRAIFAKEKSFDHVIAGNVFVLRDAVEPAVFLGSDSVGIELRDNVFYGARPPLVAFAGGRTALAADTGNLARPDIPDELPPRPAPAVASIFAWQRAQKNASAQATTAKTQKHP